MVKKKKFFHLNDFKTNKKKKRHQWVHYISDSTPDKIPEIKDIRYQKKFHQNYTGTDKKYLPSSLTTEDDKYTKPKGGHELFDFNKFRENFSK